jgi:nanoRNase/pAp phosphatase (c-di-AMP/oligoRNAs hydrolase)
MSKRYLESLLRTVAGFSRILILPHNNPDPDAIASALALQYILAERGGIESDIAYRGIVGRAENRALVRYLGEPLRLLTELALPPMVRVAMIDTQPNAGNVTLPPDASVALVLDHHPWRLETADADFSDVRPEVGATSTILIDYLQAADLSPPPPLATALFYGIKTNTMGLARNASPMDASAYSYLQSFLDVGALAQIEQAQVPADYFRNFDAALRQAQIYDGIILTYVGPMAYPDLAAELADVLLRLEKSNWVICMGVYADALFVSVRTRNPEGGAEQLVEAIVGPEGPSGGQRMMAGGQIPLRGRSGDEVAHQLGQRALEYFQMLPETGGNPLI